MKENTKLIYVLDSSAFIGFDFPALQTLGTRKLMTVNSVLQELKDFRSKANSEVLLQTNKMVVIFPDSKIIESVKKKLLRLDPKKRLSETDIEVLSLAKQVDGVIITNDFAMQNIAKQINIPIHVISGKKIAEIRKSFLKCKKCKKVIPESYHRCPDCGGELKEYYLKENKGA